MNKKRSGIYIHIPFCRKKCFYCDFYSEEISSKNNLSEYTDKVVYQLGKRWNELNSAEIISIYIGGGSPSLLGIKNVKKITQFFKEKGIVFKDIEFTMEVNPQDVAGEILEALKSEGINRLSIGIQAFDEKTLFEMGRMSQTLDIEKALSLIKEYFTNFSIDIIYGIGKERDLEKELCSIFSMAIPLHVSAYAYSPPERVSAPEQLVDEDAEFQQNRIRDFLVRKGFERYEVSNYSVKGKESVHNKIYWNYGSWLGIGAGAHSFSRNKREYSFYSDDLGDFMKDQGLSRYYPTVEEQVKEFLLMGLRLAKGISLHEFEDFFQKSFRCFFDIKSIETLVKERFCKMNEESLKCTDKGLDFLNYVLIKLFENMKEQSGC